ncbi:MAG: metallophosphoesterase [Candidatus Omnitrophota bacterium]
MKKNVRLAAAADLHCDSHNRDFLRELFKAMNDSADVLLFCGDLTDRGLPEEAKGFRALLEPVTVPAVAVLGNHDFDAGKQEEIKQILSLGPVSLLDGEECREEGVGFAGVKGFAGGFGKYRLQAWGERVLKNFVEEAKEEALKLESALARLEEAPRVALMHYSPVSGIAQGEPLEIYPFLGSSHLEVPIDQFGVTLVLCGHAHRGCPEGATAGKVPVYNVSIPMLQKYFPERPPFRVVEIPLDEKKENPAHP